MSQPTSSNQMTLDQFEEKLLEGERWVELVNGKLVRLSPPDDVHGDVVRNLAGALAAFLKKSKDFYACFELPLVVRHDPPIVRCPAVSCFRIQSQGRFAETDKLYTETCPALVIEVASTSERRGAMADRVRGYREWGVEAIWVIDPISRHVHQFHGQHGEQMVKEPQVLLGHPVLSGFSMPVSDLFRPPAWLNDKKSLSEDF